MYISTLKLQQISLITKSIDTYNSSNSRYLRLFLSKFKDSQRAVWLPLLLRKMFALWCLQRAFVLGLELCPAY